MWLVTIVFGVVTMQLTLCCQQFVGRARMFVASPAVRSAVSVPRRTSYQRYAKSRRRAGLMALNEHPARGPTLVQCLWRAASVNASTCRERRRRQLRTCSADRLGCA